MVTFGPVHYPNHSHAIFRCTPLHCLAACHFSIEEELPVKASCLRSLHAAAANLCRDSTGFHIDFTSAWAGQLFIAHPEKPSTKNFRNLIYPSSKSPQHSTKKSVTSFPASQKISTCSGQNSTQFFPSPSAHFGWRRHFHSP